MAVDSAGNVYVADSYELHDPESDAGGSGDDAGRTGGRSGSADGTGSAARFDYPMGVAVDSAGNVYVADYDNNTIRKVTPAGVVTTLAGLAGNSGSADGTGSAARFNSPYGVAVDSAGNVYVADTGNNTIRKVTPAGVVTTLAGLAGNSGSADGTGSAARFMILTAWRWTARATSMWRTANNNTIRKVTPAGVVTTLAGLAGVWPFWQLGHRRRDGERRAVCVAYGRGGGQRGQRLCGGPIQQQHPERISRQLCAGAEFYSRRA